MKKGNKKAIAFLVTLALLISSILPFEAAYGAVPAAQDAHNETVLSDIAGHWGKEVIKNAVKAGFVQGYGDGTFKPNKYVSRGEFVTMVNKALKLRDENTVNLAFEDVKDTAWYYKDIQKACYAGYINGISDTLFMPGRNITREEAAVMLAAFLPKEGYRSEAALASYPDTANISAWAKTSMAVVVNKGYLSGHPGGMLAPKSALTRAEAAKLIGSILDNETIIREDVSIEKSGEILKNAIYTGDITIEASVGEGDAGLRNISALSKVYVLGGGANTVTLSNTVIIRLIVGKEGTSVRVLSEDGNTIHEAFVFNDNLLVGSKGEGISSGESGFENIIRLNGTVSAEIAIRIANEIAGRIDNTGNITLQQVLDGVRAVIPDAAAVVDENGSIVVTVPGTTDTGDKQRRRHHHDPDDNAPVLTVNGQPATVTAITDATCGCSIPTSSGGGISGRRGI